MPNGQVCRAEPIEYEDSQNNSSLFASVYYTERDGVKVEERMSLWGFDRERESLSTRFRFRIVLSYANTCWNPLWENFAFLSGQAPSVLVVSL